MKRIFWFLSVYSSRPDGGTLMILQHHKKLLQNNIESYIVCIDTPNKMNWIGENIYNTISFYDAVKQINQNDISISSWDQHINNTFSKLKGKRIAYLQSHFANHPLSYQTNLQIWTVSNYAKNFIDVKYNKNCKVLQNVVRLPNYIKPIKFEQKQNRIVTAYPRRDFDVLYKLQKYFDNKIQVLEDWYDRATFLGHVNRSKYYLSFYREDAFGLPPIEAMRMGTIPIVISNSTGKDYGKHGQNGYFINQDMIWVLKNVNVLNYYQRIQNALRLSENAIKMAEEYRQSKILEII